MNKKYVFIEATREGYAPEQVDGITFTVRELIEYLSDFDPDAPVYISNDNGFTYGSVNDETVYTHCVDDDD